MEGESMKKNKLFKMTCLSALAATMAFSYGYSAVPLFTSHSYVSQVEAASGRVITNDKLYEVMKILVNAQNAGVNPYSGINADTTDITTVASLAKYKTPELTGDNITDYVGVVNLRPYTNLKGSDLAGLNKATQVTEIDLPTSVDSLPNGAFEKMLGLKTVKMSNAVKTIGVNAFQGCSALEKVYVYGTTETAGLVDLSNVTSIGNSAFLGCRSFTGLKLSSGLRLLDSNAFSNCASLNGQVDIPNGGSAGPVKLGTGVFQGCSSLDKITFPADITAIPAAFLNGTGARNENVPVNTLDVVFAPNSKITTIGNSAFRDTNISSINIENLAGSLTTIDRSAFQRSFILGDFKIDSLGKLKNIGIAAFWNAQFLNGDITLPASVTDIGSAAFCASNISTINIPDGVTTLSDGAFCYAYNLQNVKINTTSQLKVVGNYAFGFDAGLRSTAFLKSASKLTTIGSYAFTFCYEPSGDSLVGLTTVDLPSSVTSIGDHCFYDTPTITNVISLGSISSVSPYMFALQAINQFPSWPNQIEFASSEGINDKVGIEFGDMKYYTTLKIIPELSSTMSVTLPTSVKVIDEHAFEYRERLDKVAVSGSSVSKGTVDLSKLTALTDIKDDAFNFCSYYAANDNTVNADKSKIEGIKKLILPASLANIGVEAFQNNRGLEEVQFSNGGNLKTIDKRAFAACYPSARIPEACGLQTLTNLNTLNKLETIGESAFDGDIWLKLDKSDSIFKFPNALKTIGNRAFYDCKYTEQIQFNSALETIGNQAFSYNINVAPASELKTINFINAKSLKALGSSAFENDNKILYAEMDVTKIEKVSTRAFAGCSSLISFTAPDDYLKSIEANAFEQCSSLSSITFPVDASISTATFGNEPKTIPKLNITLGTLKKGLDVPFGQKISFEANAFVNTKTRIFQRKKSDGSYVKLVEDTEDYFTMEFDNLKFYITGGAEAKADGSSANIVGTWAFGNKSATASVDIPVNVKGVRATGVMMPKDKQREVTLVVDNANNEVSGNYPWVNATTSTNPANYVGYVNSTRIPINPDQDFIATLQANISPSVFTYGFKTANTLRWEVASGGNVLSIEGEPVNTLPQDAKGVTETKEGSYFTTVQKVRIKSKGEATLRLIYSFKDYNPSTGKWDTKYDCVNLIKVNVVNPISKFDMILKETDKASNGIELIQGNTSNIIIDKKSIEHADKNSIGNDEPASFIYYSDCPEIATVNSNGVITAQKIYDNGYYEKNKRNSCGITVRTLTGSVARRINVTVRKSKEETVPTELTIIGDEYLNIGGISKTYKIQNIPALSNEKVEWSINGGSATLKQVGNDAVLTPVRAGLVTLRAQSVLGGVAAQINVKIVNPTKDIRFMMKSASVEVDSMYSFGFVSDDKAQAGIYRPKDNDDFVTFTIADASVAGFVVNGGKETTNKICVNTGNISIKGLKEGKTIITATTESGGKAQFTIAVTKKTLKAIKIKEKASVEAGKSITLKVTKTPADSNEGYTFSSTNTAVAIVDPYTGKVTGVKEGTCNIVVTSDIKRVTATCQLTVKKNTSGYVTADGKTFVDESGKKWKLASKVSNNQLKKNLMVADKSSSGKYKITKVVKKGGKIASGTVAYMGPYNKKCTKATVPNKVKIGGATFSVTKVANNAFKGCTKLKSMTIGTNVTSIGNMSFSGCTSLKTVTIKSTKLTKIGSKAFYGDKKLSKFTIKSSKLKSVGAGAFKNTSAKLKVKAPKAKVAAYTKLFKKGGAASTVKVTK